MQPCAHDGFYGTGLDALAIGNYLVETSLSSSSNHERYVPVLKLGAPRAVLAGLCLISPDVDSDQTSVAT